MSRCEMLSLFHLQNELPTRANEASDINCMCDTQNHRRSTAKFHLQHAHWGVVRRLALSLRWRLTALSWPTCQLANWLADFLACHWPCHGRSVSIFLSAIIFCCPNSPTRSAETLVSGVAPKSNESPHFGHDLLFACAIAARTCVTPVLCPLYSTVHCRTPSCASVWLGRACECNVNDTQMGHTPPRHGLQFMAEWQMPNGQNCSQLMHTHSTTHTHTHRHV